MAIYYNENIYTFIMKKEKRINLPIENSGIHFRISNSLQKISFLSDILVFLIFLFKYKKKKKENKKN